MAEEPDLRAGIRVSWISVVWTLLASGVAVEEGIRAKTLVLIAFGLTGLLDMAGSIAIALHLRHALAHEAISPSRERFALRLVSVGLMVVGALTIVESIRRLATHAHTLRSGVGIAVAGASAGVLGVLACRKRVIAARIPSAALRADGMLSATGAALATVTLVGTVLTRSRRLYWFDAAAALLVALAATISGVVELRREAGELDA